MRGEKGRKGRRSVDISDKAYFLLFNGITDSIRALEMVLEKFDEGKTETLLKYEITRLKVLQVQAEELVTRDE